MNITKEEKRIKYSQNFLRSRELIKKLLNKSSICSNDLVLEIGPGKGIITEQLARGCIKVIGVEKDRKLCDGLFQKFRENNKVEIKCEDFLKYRLPAEEKYKIFSNIPFNLTADIIGKITSADNPPEDAYLIVQEEAAQKFSGSLYGKERQYSLLLKPWFEVKIMHHFKRTDFYPVPSVEIVLLRIKKRENQLIDRKQMQHYRDFIIYGFNQWKPTLKKSLDRIFTYEQLKRLTKNLGFDRSAVPTDLSFQQWLGLFNYFLIGVEEYKKRLVSGSEALLKNQQNRIQKIHRTRS